MRAAVAKKMKSQRHLDPSVFDPTASAPAARTTAAVFPVKNKTESTGLGARNCIGGSGAAGGKRAGVVGVIVKVNHPRPDLNSQQNKTKAKPLNYSPVFQHTTHTSLYLVYNGRAACAQSRTPRLEPKSSQVKPNNSQPCNTCCMAAWALVDAKLAATRLDAAAL